MYKTKNISCYLDAFVTADSESVNIAQTKKVLVFDNECIYVLLKIFRNIITPFHF